MTDLITLTGMAIDHQAAEGAVIPLGGRSVHAYPSSAITRTADGEVAATDARTTVAEDSTFTLELVWAEGLRYRIVLLVETSRGTVKERLLGTLDCDSWPAGSTVTIADLPPIAGVPPSAVEALQAWILARIAEGKSPETIEAAVIAYLAANPVGIPAHNDTTGRDAADQHPISAITGLSDVLSLIPDSPEDIGAATAEQGSKADTAVQPESLHPVATSGQYGDLESLPDLAGLPYRPDDWEPDLSNLVVTTDPRLSDARPPLGDVTAIVALSQTNYDDLDPPDESTLYVITD